MILAVDFGTSNSLAALATKEGHGSPIPMDELAKDPTVFRTLLYFPNQNTCFYGQKAVDQYVEHQGEGRFIRSIKKFLPSQTYLGSWIEDRVVKIEDLVGFFLLEMKRRAEKHTGKSLERVLLGRPAQYSEDPSADQLAVHRMRKAAEIAGFKEVHFFEEPIAAALDFRATLSSWKTVLVVDLGGGTSDFTVMRIGPGPFKAEDVLAKGAVSVAGDVIDGRLMAEFFAHDFGSEVKYKVPLGSNVLTMPPTLLDKICSPADITQLMRNDYFHFLKQVESWSLGGNDRTALRRLFTLCEDQQGFAFFDRIENMKRDFSQSRQHHFAFDYPEIEIEKDLTVNDFNQACQNPIRRILNKLDEVMKAAQVKPAAIEAIYCTGGTSRLKGMHEALVQIFGPERISSNKHFHSVIDGLAARACELL